MREILFRGKCKENGEWVEGDLFHNHILDGVSDKQTRIGNIYFSGDEIHGTAFYEVIPETVGQYTGLTDKNGKKIFEGDIVEYEHEHYIGHYTVEYIEDLGLVANEIEVVGNIHDNPELV